ncbi:agmatine deiminase family protein [Adhaeribacter aquaticus]|uniref:agmatine deiminase family protein n=1 Tax=Adhaeribacter aquaticus TaxID=299567 RepID=UPI0008FEE721|nr:agmatine deiminase family protein [Adhaeribacter aquaticus]
MVTDNQTNFLFLADSLPKKYPDFYQRFEKILTDNNIHFSSLLGTKDIWCRDYMPIQVNADKYVQFIYNPDYLQSKKWQKTISDVDAICEAIGIRPLKSNIKFDGGNLVRSANKIIMCDKVFRENPQIPEKQLIKDLEELLEVEHLIFIPTDSSDTIGHADGMVRFLDDKTVLINNYSKENPQFQRTFRLALHNAGLDWIEIPYNPYGNKKLIQANGSYINYLQVENVVIIPSFGIEKDIQTLSKFKQLFPNYKVSNIDCNDIANEGGILNCVSWNLVKIAPL